MANNKEDVIIPPLLDGYSVVEIADHAFEFINQRGDLFPNEDTKYTDALITIPDSITAIGDFAFFNASINSINIPNSVQSIGKGAFSHTSATGIQFRISPDQPYFAVIDNSLYNKQKKELICGFGDTIPEGIVSIGDYAFYQQLNKTIEIPGSVTSVGSYAFYEVIDLQLDWKGNDKEDNIITIGEYAFCGVSGCLQFPTCEAIIGCHSFEHAILPELECVSKSINLSESWRKMQLVDENQKENRW